ncbi:hypothetical protein [Bradyrhizobium elkanii]|uniref:hypothetical protein n=1 Tax=Bradyrhizobium elkanii TaxID=29448 RepID=UPI003515E566
MSQVRVSGFLAQEGDVFSGPVTIDGVAYRIAVGTDESTAQKSSKGTPYYQGALSDENGAVQGIARFFKRRDYGVVGKPGVLLFLKIKVDDLGNTYDVTVVGWLNDRKKDGTLYPSPIYSLKEDRSQPAAA